MLAGATGIDFVLLVVAADDGVMPQTREHLAIVDLLGIDARHRGADQVRSRRRRSGAPRSTAEIAHAAGRTGLAGSRDRSGFDRHRRRHRRSARAAVRGARRASARAPRAGRFRLAVDRSFTLAGAGTVVTGTVLSGAVGVGDRVLVSPSGLPARVRSIHAQNRPAERGQAGRALRAQPCRRRHRKDAIARGDVVLDPALHAPTDRIDATLARAAPREHEADRPVDAGAAASCRRRRRRRASCCSATSRSRPASEAHVQLVLEQPIAAAAGDRFVLRDTTAQRTIGGGRFLDLRAPARKRRTPERLAQLDAHAIDDPDAALAALLDRAAAAMSTSRRFARDRASAAAEIDATVERGTVDPHRGHHARASRRRPGCGSSARLLATLEAFHADNPDLPGMGLERLRLQLEPRLPAPAFRRSAARAVARRRGGAGRRLGAAARPRGPPHAAGRGALERDPAAARRQPNASVRRACATSPDALGAAEADVRRLLEACSAAWARSTRSRTTISSCAARSPRWWTSPSTSRRRPRAASSPRRSFATGSTTAARSRSRFSNSSTATA